MKHICPYCDWPEFAPEHAVETAGRGIFGLFFRRAGKIVRCARCTRQYAIGQQGAYKITPERERVTSGPPVAEPKPAALTLVDEDQAEAWR